MKTKWQKPKLAPTLNRWPAYLVASKVTCVGYGGVGIVLEWLLHFTIRIIIIIWIYLQHEGFKLKREDIQLKHDLFNIVKPSINHQSQNIMNTCPWSGNSLVPLFIINSLMNLINGTIKSSNTIFLTPSSILKLQANLIYKYHSIQRYLQVTHEATVTFVLT